MLRRIVLLCFVFVSLPAHAELNLKPVHPDEDADYTFNQRFSVQDSLSTLNQINSALESFRKLTELSVGKIPEEKLKEIGNTGWEIQNLGFMNWGGAIKGTLYKQDYLIKKLEYELALEKAKNGKTNKDELLTAEKAFNEAEKKFQAFWNSFSIGD